MHPVIAKTFGGLSREYYFRQFVFGLIFPAFVVYMSMESGRAPQAGVIAVFIVNTLLYPYSRFVYESIMGFIFGKNEFYVNAILMLFVKFMTMAMCWSFAIFIAPLGLAYLYYYHSKANPETE